MSQSPQGVPFTVVASTAYGQMLVNRHDLNQTDALFKTGIAPHHDEINMLAQLLGKCRTDAVVIDVGANFGSFTLALAPMVGARGRVYAFEAQRLIFYMLAGSVALNALTNVYCYHAAVGDREGLIEAPQFDYGKPMNFGSIEFGPIQQEQLTQTRSYDPARVEQVRLMMLDTLELPRLDLIKVDVEGMEAEVLAGAARTIRRCRPILFVEHYKSDRPALRAQMEELGCEVFEAGINYLGIPAETLLAEQIRNQLAMV